MRASWCWIAIGLMVPTVPASAAQTRAFAITTDYMGPGSLSVMDLDTRAVSQDVAIVGSDPVVRWHGGLIYVVNRFGGDNIQVLDPSQGYATRQFPVPPNGSNPQDISFVSPTKAYVTRYDSADLLIVNPASADGGPMSVISLAAFADADGKPEMARMIRLGRWLFVACQRLTSFQPSNPSMVVVVDTQADTVFDVNPLQPGIQAITLAARNPSTAFAYDAAGARLLIGMLGAYGVLDGGIEAIGLDGLSSQGLLITESELGGDVSDVAWHAATKCYATVTVGETNELVTWNPTTGQRLALLHTAPGGFSLPDIERNDRGELYACRNPSPESGSPSGMLVFDTDTDLLLAGPLSTGRPPISLTFDQDAAPVGVASVLGAVRLAPPWPNPAVGTVHIRLVLERPGAMRLEVLDIAGRLVRALADGESAAGRHEHVWDLTDDHGGRVAAGVFLIRARAGGLEATRRLAVLR
jgi:flagellar hook capping protein FlgD